MEEDPGAVLADDLLGLAPAGVALRGIGLGHRLVVEPVERGVAVVAVVGARGDVLRVEELQEVLGVGIVADPAQHEQRDIALVDGLEVGGPGHVARLEADADAVEEALHELDLLAGGLVGPADRDRDLEAAARPGVDAVRVPGLGEELLRAREVE